MSDADPRPVATSLYLPPLGNSFVIGLASGETASAGLGSDATAEVALAVEDVPGGTEAPFEVRDAVFPAIGRLLSETNSQFFRFDITDLGERGEPLVLRLAAGSAELRELAVSDAHSTRKLVVLVPVIVPDGSSAEIRFEAFDKAKPVEAGTALMFPSYMVPTLVVDGDEDVVLLAVHALGPVFR